MKKKEEKKHKGCEKQKWLKPLEPYIYIYIYISILLQTSEICLLNRKCLLKVSFIFDAKKSEKNRVKNRIENSKKLTKEAIKKWINKKDGLLYGKLESINLSSYKPYDSLSFL